MARTSTMTLTTTASGSANSEMTSSGGLPIMIGSGLILMTPRYEHCNTAIAHAKSARETIDQAAELVADDVL